MKKIDDGDVTFARLDLQVHANASMEHYRLVEKAMMRLSTAQHGFREAGDAAGLTALQDAVAKAVIDICERESEAAGRQLRLN